MTNHFRTDVVWCAKNCIGSNISRCHQLGNTKVADFHNTFLCQEDVCSFEISATKIDESFTAHCCKVKLHIVQVHVM